MPIDTDSSFVDELLTNGSLELEGRLVEASNASFLATVTLDEVSAACVYKPVAGERPLWDFPDRTLARRERAARVVSEAGGWHVVPPTVLREEGRFGSGMVQLWIDVDPAATLIDVVEPGEAVEDWIVVLEAETRGGDPVLLVHADDDRLRSLAVFDIVVNNADRKGGHVLPDQTGSVWACDHGVTFHEEKKLRTVLWGWAGEPLRDIDLEALDRVREGLDGSLRSELVDLLSGEEIEALRRRVVRLQVKARMPVPTGSWPPIPWPAL